MTGPDDETLEAAWLCLGSDRASENYCVARLWFEIVMECRLSIPYIAFCGGHGVILARLRPLLSKRVLTAFGSFTKWMRIGKNMQEIENVLPDVVRDASLIWYKHARPAEEVAAASKFKAALFPHDEVLWSMARLSLSRRCCN